MEVKKMSLTKKHFEELAKIHGNAYRMKSQGHLETAFRIFDQGLNSFYAKNNPRFDSLLFARSVAKYSK